MHYALEIKRHHLDGPPSVQLKKLAAQSEDAAMTEAMQYQLFQPSDPKIVGTDFRILSISRTEWESILEEPRG